MVAPHKNGSVEHPDGLQARLARARSTRRPSSRTSSRSVDSERPTTVLGSPSTRVMNGPPRLSMVKAPATSSGSPAGHVGVDLVVGDVGEGDGGDGAASDATGSRRRGGGRSASARSAGARCGRAAPATVRGPPPARAACRRSPPSSSKAESPPKMSPSIGSPSWSPRTASAFSRASSWTIVAAGRGPCSASAASDGGGLVDVRGNDDRLDAGRAQQGEAGRRGGGQVEAHGFLWDARRMPQFDEVDLDITNVAHGGVFVARHEGRVVFVPDTLPGERIRARITDRTHDSFWRAETLEVLDAAPERQPHIWEAASIDRDPGRARGRRRVRAHPPRSPARAEAARARRRARAAWRSCDSDVDGRAGCRRDARRHAAGAPACACRSDADGGHRPVRRALAHA